jgi:hypothetical protein
VIPQILILTSTTPLNSKAALGRKPVFGKVAAMVQPEPAVRLHPFSDFRPLLRSAGFQTCRAADFQVGTTGMRPAGLETCDTADSEVCATLNPYRRRAESLPRWPVVTALEEGL